MNPETVSWAAAAVGLFVVWTTVWFVLGARYGMKLLTVKMRQGYGGQS